MIVVVLRSLFNIVSLLVDEGANLDLRDGNGYTAVMWAIYKGNWDHVDILLDAGCDVTLEDLMKLAAIKDFPHVNILRYVQDYCNLQEYCLCCGKISTPVENVSVNPDVDETNGN